jgi:phosphatidylglycerophosphatase A
MKLVELIVTFSYLGKVGKAPGTLASFVTALLFFILLNYLTTFSFLLIIIFLIGVACFTIHCYTINLIDKDKKEIVIDEVVGQLIASAPLIFVTNNNLSHLNSILLSFLFFRFFDIVKPFPINKFDKINNTFGIIFDDILAGLFAALVVTLILVF